ncbi:MAG: alpha-1,2-fucosyltransferase [Lentisphaeria bacterium]|nr:alpha-1,2-fucosyltransferase [Lentisphaeria bacterium]
MNRIVTTELAGGLGNQLFRYAAGRALALRGGARLRLDVAHFKFDHTYGRVYQLDKFSLPKDVVCVETYTTKLGFYFNRLKDRIGQRTQLCWPGHLREYPGTRVDRRCLLFKEGCLQPLRRKAVYLQGYWQSPQYFADCADTIRKDLTISAPHASVKIEEARTINSKTDSVCVGIRKYAEVPAHKQGYHRVQTLDYYQAGIQLILETCPDAHFFITSDDPAWVEANLTLEAPHTYLTMIPGDENSYEDLWTMSQCRHFIISNSSYHWWGAWLAEKDGKTVIAPKDGFKNRDIYPSEWITL